MAYFSLEPAVQPGSRKLRRGQSSCTANLNLSGPTQADEGFLYPLERAFFYINKPPMLLPHDDIEEIEFGRPDGNMAASTKTFDLIVRTRAPGSQVSTQTGSCACVQT